MQSQRKIRLIPAHAGKTSAPPSTRRPRAAHPRSRGENTPRPFTASHRAGSSPLTRGKPTHAACQGVGDRLIPAHAGKTRPKSDAGIQGAAHPRSRGENGHGPMTGATHPGSSPLTRGKPGGTPLGPPPAGLIPAHAGKTRVFRVVRGSGAAHPRSRGENTVAALALHGNAGSSPLTRGKRFLQLEAD